MANGEFDNLTVNKLSELKGKVGIGTQDDLRVGYDYLSNKLEVKGGNVGIFGRLFVEPGQGDPHKEITPESGLDGISIDRDDKTGIIYLQGYRDHFDEGYEPTYLALQPQGGKVGIGTTNPQHELDVSGTSIKLGLEKNAGGQLIICNNEGDNSIYLEAFNTGGNASASQMVLSGINGSNVPLLNMYADDTFFHGSVDVTASTIKLGLQKNGGGQLIICNNKGDNKIFLEAFDTGGNVSASEMLLTGANGSNVPLLSMCADNTIFNGNVGVGTDAPLANLHVANGAILNNIAIGAAVHGALTNPYETIQIHKDNNLRINFGTIQTAIFRNDGTVGIGVEHPEGKLEVNGDIRAHDVFLAGGDCAEDFDITCAEHVEPGTVMVIDRDGALRPSFQAFDKRVAGVISGAGDLRPGITLDRQNERANRLPIALTGKVYCKVVADNEPVEVGDLLTTSTTLGHAMKANDPIKSFGAVIGKALKSLETGRSLIPILVALQ